MALGAPQGTGFGPGSGAAAATIGQSSVTIAWTFTGSVLSQTFQAGPFQNIYSIQSQQVQALTAGNNTITVPPNAGGIILIPPSANTSLLTLKGVAGDTGIPVNKLLPFVFAFDTTPPASIVINAATNVNVQIVWL